MGKLIKALSRQKKGYCFHSAKDAMCHFTHIGPTGWLVHFVFRPLNVLHEKPYTDGPLIYVNYNDITQKILTNKKLYAGL